MNPARTLGKPQYRIHVLSVYLFLVCLRPMLICSDSLAPLLEALELFSNLYAVDVSTSKIGS